MKNYFLKIRFLAAVITAIAVSILNILIPSVTQKLIDSAVTIELSNIPKYVLQYLVVIVLIIIIEYLRKVTLAKYITQRTKKLRNKHLSLYYKKHNYSIAKMSSQDYISIFNNDIQTVAKDYYGTSVDITMSIFSIIIYSVALFLINPIIMCFALAANLISIAVPFIMKKSLVNSRQEHLESMKKYNNKLSDAICGHITVKVNNIKESILHLVSLSSENNLNKNIEFEKKQAISDVVVGLFSFLSLFAILSIGVHYITINLITIGALFAAIQISDLLVMPIINVSSEISSFISAGKINKNLNVAFNSDLFEKDISYKAQKIKILELKNIQAWKKDKLIIKIGKLTINQGKKYLITGENGSGKSTLLNIIAGIEENYTGDIIVNGEKVNDKTPLYHFGYSTQKPFLFNDTLINNITLYKNYEKSKLDEILSLLNINQLIMEKGNAIYTDNDEKISGGEKQKIAIARVLLYQNDFLLLDEATSAMDKQSSLSIEKYLLFNPNLTLLYVAHKTHKETVDMFDEIIKM